MFQKNKVFPFVFLFVGLFLVFSGSVFAYQYIFKKIPQCTPGSNEACFESLKEAPGVYRYSIKNLDEDKKYRLEVKKKDGDDEIEVGQVDIDMSEVKEKTENQSCFPYKQSSDVESIACCDGLALKTDLWNDSGWSQFTCCKSSECAQDGICIQSGKAFADFGKKCDNGTWIDYSAPSSGTTVSNNSSTCSDSDGGVDFYTKGTLTWTTQGFQAEDYCDSTTGELMEYFCMDGYDMYEDRGYICPNGCLDGACIADSSCDGHQVNASTASGLNCCGDLVVKDDLWMQSDPSYFNYACCNPGECHQDNTCVPNGSDFNSSPTDWGVKCVDGVWEGTLK